MDPRIGSLWLLATCMGIVMLSCYISGVACDVPDDVVYTDLHKTVRIGDSVVLKCQFRGTPLAVNWKKGDDPIRAPNLVSWIPGDPVTGSCVRERLCPIMEMNAEFSLIIKEVSIVEQGRYVCVVANYKGLQIHNFTDISVFSPPKEPYPIINECQMISPNDTETTCTISKSQSVEISCSASGYFPDIDLYFLHGSIRLYTKEPIEVTNLDGTKNKTVSAIATASEIRYICFASIPGSQEQRTTTVLVNLLETPFPMPAGPTIPIDKTDGSVAKVVIPVILIVLAVICISIILLRWKRQRSQGTYAKVTSVGKIDGIISYFELEQLVEKFDVGFLSQIVAELMEDSEGELESELMKADLYRYLCKWKESSSGSAILLYSAMEKNNLENGPQMVEDFLASIDKAVSDDDLEHICWHVHSCRKTVQPIVVSSTNSTKPADSGHISAPSRYDIWDDLQIMKRWKAMSAQTMYGDEDEHCEETVKVCTKSEEIRFKSKHTPTTWWPVLQQKKKKKTESMPSNQMIQLCRALEKAGRMTGDSEGQVYHQLSKTFYKIREEYKSELTDKVLKEFALNITERHCQKLGNTLKHSACAIAHRNEEDLEMFGTDIMLKLWVLDQKCSNYEIRRRLRQAAEECNRQDIADDFISKKQSEVMTSTLKQQACLTITNEKQNPVASASESISSISCDELDRIGRYTGSSVLRAFCKKYGVTVVPEQLLEIINVLKATLDSELERIKKEKKPPNTLRKSLRQLLEKEHPRYACLLALRKPYNIFNVELIDLAFRLIMADVYPFAKALNISDQVLTAYRGDLGPHNLTQGTANIMKQESIDNRVKMVTALRQAGYSEEAKALYFGFEISVGDVIEVENRVDKAQLAKQLGVSNDVQPTGPDNKGKDDTLHQSVLVRWRNTVRSSTFNHRLALADALFTMGEKQLALDIISGVYRNRVINESILKQLGDPIPEEQGPILRKILDQMMTNEEGLLKWSAKSPIESSNKLLGAGFYAFAHENMAVFHHGTDTGNVATEDLCQEGIAINEPGEKEGKEEKEGMDKATNGDSLVDNTGKEGTIKGEVREKELEPVVMPKDNETIPTEGIQEANTSEEGEEVMQEKSGDGAAESKENTTENVDTKEQDGSDECRGNESSKLLTQA